MKYLNIFLGGLIMHIFMFINITMASSYVYSKTGEELQLSVKNAQSKSSVVWIITQDGKILDTIKKKKLKYKFLKDGLYTIRVNEELKNGDVKSSLVKVNVSVKIPAFAPLSANLTTIPATIDGVVTLHGEKEEVVFSFLDSTGDIKTYELESDIFVDSDNDEIPDNDIDNKNHASYLSGTYFKRTYINTGIPSRAILTVRDENGNEKTASVTIIFDEESDDLIVKPLGVEVTTLPEKTSSDEIELSANTDAVFVFAGKSTGKISQYKIDENLEIDSDGDGDATNDFDNKGTDSADTGSSYPITIDKNSDVQRFSVTIVGEYDEKRKEYTVKNNKSYGVQGADSLEPILFSSRTKVLQKETVTFNIFNYPKGTKVSWDFNGDGVFEIKDSEVEKVEYLYAEEGVYNVVCSLKEDGKPAYIQRKIITVLNQAEGQLKTNPPFAHFYPQVAGNKASFISSQSKADENLANTELSYSWDFGDGFKAQGPNVEHIYEKPGNYTVILTVEDSISRKGVYSDTFVIAELTQDFEESQHGGSVIRENINKEGGNDSASEIIDAEKLITNPDDPETAGKAGSDGWEKIDPAPPTDVSHGSVDNPVGESSGFPWWIFILFVLLLLPILFLLKKKIDNPDKDFSEIIKDLQGKKSLEELKEESNNTKEKEEKEEIEEIEEKEEVGEIGEEEESIDQLNDDVKVNTQAETIAESESNNNDAISTENLPDWMKNAEDTEGETEEKTDEKIEEDNQNIAQEIGDENSVEHANLPDWMKDETVEEKENNSVEIGETNILSDPFDIPEHSEKETEEILENIEENSNTVNPETEINIEPETQPEIEPEIEPEELEEAKEKVELPDWMKDSEDENAKLDEPENIQEQVRTEEILENIEENSDILNPETEINIEPETQPETREELEELEELEEPKEKVEVPDWMKDGENEDVKLDEPENIQKQVQTEEILENIEENSNTVNPETEINVEQKTQLDALEEDAQENNQKAIIEKPVITAVDAKIKKENSGKIPEWLDGVK